MARPHPARAKRNIDSPSDLREILSQYGSERSTRRFAKGRVIFRAGERANRLFFIQHGRVKISVISEEGKEAILILPGSGDLIGEGALAPDHPSYFTTATAITDSVLLPIEAIHFRQLLHENQRVAQAVLSYLLTKSRQLQESLADQLFEDSEKRLAKILWSLAEVDNAPGNFIPRITHQTFAEMVGTTRPRISFFMNRFRKLGFIEYKNRELYVNRSIQDYVRRP